MSNPTTFDNVEAVAAHLREKLIDKRFVLLFAYNGTGKTRLSMAYKDAGKEGKNKDTLYFNAFTEDLFHWDNDIELDQERVLQINTSSKFFNGLKELEMENRIGSMFQRYADLNFFIDYDNGTISFEREVYDGGATNKAENSAAYTDL